MTAKTNHINSKLDSSTNLSSKQMRVAKVKEYVESNDADSFRLLMLSRKEYLHMRF